MWKTSLTAFFAVLLLAGTATAATPIKIIDEKGIAEFSASVTDGWESWTANSLAHPNQNHGYVRPTGGPATKIPIGGDVRTGGIITTGAYAGKIAVRSDLGGDQNISFYDLTTGVVSAPPPGVNSAADDFAPSVSGDYLAFVRGSKLRNLRLYRLSTGKTIVLQSGVYRVQVNGDYVIYDFCTRRTCVVARYRISTGRTVRAPAPAPGRANYDPAVAGDGTMYWVEGAAKYCGKHTKIRTLIGNTVVTLWSAPAGGEVGYLELDTLGGNPTLSYSLALCPYSSNRWGAYRIDV